MTQSIKNNQEVKRVVDRIIGIGSAALDLIYPASLYCACCGKIIDESRTYKLCNECMDGMKWISARTCGKCGRRLSEANPTGVCFNCREHAHAFNTGYTCTEYGTHERAMAFALKYDGRSDLAVVMGEIMADRMLAEFTDAELRSMYDLALPVPVHPHKKRVRGYNQAALLAEVFAGKTGLKTSDGILVRVRETHVMKYLGPDQRRQNIRGAFGLKQGKAEEIKDKSILIVDDIYTTGATVDELAQVLADAGAKRVDFLTFAAGADVIKV